jgi:hypothetical protein
MRFQIRETEEGAMVSILLGNKWCYVRHFNELSEAKRVLWECEVDIHNQVRKRRREET